MGKGIMFMMFLWLAVSIAGGVSQGTTVSVATTALTANITDVTAVIPVGDTTGFPNTGTVSILDERIAYSSKTAVALQGNFARPLRRGISGTEAVAHAEGELVRTVESSMMNQSMGYNLAVLSDSSGSLAFVTIPFAFLSLIGSFFILPLAFLGSDLEILTYLWGVISIGLLVSIGIALAGGRRV